MCLEPSRETGLFVLGRGGPWLLGVAGEREEEEEEEEKAGKQIARACAGLALRSHCRARGAYCHTSLSGA